MSTHPFNFKRPSDFWQNKSSPPDFRGEDLSSNLVCLTSNFVPDHRLRPFDNLLQQNNSNKRKKKIKNIKEINNLDNCHLRLYSHDSEVSKEPKANLEAVLFVAREPLSLRRLAQLANLPEGSQIRALLRELNENYDSRQTAFRIVEVAGGFQLRTRPEFAPWLVRIQEVPVTVRLSNPAMETLAVIAYQQPVHRAEIERLRGVQCSELIRQLLDRDLIRIEGRSEELGRPFLYGTTKTFLQVFGLGSIKDLPDWERLGKIRQNNEMDTVQLPHLN